MKYFISLRGNVYGNNPEQENNPEYVLKAIEEGFYVTIDVWVIDNKIFLGNNEPKYDIKISFLFNKKIFCFARNIEALKLMIQFRNKIHYSIYNNDYHLTSKGLVLTNNINELNEKIIHIVPENIDYTNYKIENLNKCLGICSDNIYQYMSLLEKKDDSTLFETSYGKLLIKSNDYFFMKSFKNQYYDESLLVYLLENILPYGNIVNIGAHIGSSSLIYSRLSPDDYKIYSFEPQSIMFKLLNKNIEINSLTDKCIIQNKAIFCYDGEIEMEENDLDGPERGNINSLENENKNINYAGVCVGKNGEKVECITLDSLNLDNISFIHCDTQGSESYIFSGGKEFIKKNRPFILYKDLQEEQNYIKNNIQKHYSDYENNFDIMNYCLYELKDYCMIKKIYNTSYNLLIPYLRIDNYNIENLTYEEVKNFDYTPLQVYQIPNTLVRIGSKNDGGYIIAEGFEYDYFVSCGISTDITFEIDFLNKYNVKCIAFDGTIQSFPENDKSIEWIPKNIGYVNNSKNTNLKEYIRDYNNIFLKMDIEGYEFNWIDSLSIEELQKFSQIVIEIHCPFGVYKNNILRKLSITHYPVHIHGNNCGGMIKDIIIPGIFPIVFEVTYIRKDLLDENVIYKIQKQFPTELDEKNDPSVDDISFFIPL
jgi:FkbM family methyltransferase